MLCASVSGADQPWALQPVVRPELPGDTTGGAAAHPIDRFVEAKLQEKKLLPAPRADATVLARRASLGVTGLAPSVENIRPGLAESDGQWNAFIETLLASPRYGERWARHWLDVVRFAESHGFEMNQPRENAWRYRDYVIESFNQDKPYDQFVMEQLAGDLLGPDAATGFLVAGPWDQVKSPDPVLTANQRADELHDMVSVTGTTFLGLTVGCARCHDHKFDPISQIDYFRVKAVFEGVQHGERAAAEKKNPARETEIKNAAKELADLREQIILAQPLADPTGHTPLRMPVNARLNIERFVPVSARFVRFTVAATTDIEPCIDELEIYSPGGQNVALASAGTKAKASSVYPNSTIHRLEHLNDGKHGNSQSWISNEAGKGWVELEFPRSEMIERILWGRDREEKFRDRLALNYTIEASADGATWKKIAGSNDRLPRNAESSQSSTNQLAQQEKTLEKRLRELQSLPKAYAGTFSATPEATHRWHRGDPMLKREIVEPGGLTSLRLSSSAPQRENLTEDQKRRLTLARWIVDPANPLTARVMVNRIWQHHFGRGLVTTPSDFGANGAKPSHPELLDWLAAEFISSGWSIKQIHRLILTSETYRRSSDARASGLETDAQNEWLWRYSPQRLEAEALRDCVLQASGRLDLRMGGPGFSFFAPNDNYVRLYTPRTEWSADTFRRMIYGTAIRQRVDGVFGVFDCPDAGQSAPRRTTSTTPLQALNLMNSGFLLQQANFLAKRLETEAGPDPTAQIQLAFRTVYQRDPEDHELQAARALLADQTLAIFCRALFNSNEFAYVF